ncbi:hypothetical protein AQ797_08485 [Burkholderia pseudomallei]|nr:hypothetical protein AQ797_08485 [Burkholderia pseudomallei]OMV75926.1 hypothetical protein AQ798_06390 [Burkholderia pseudomallei]OMV86554.1 hypothetical protein AQ799_11665 [Burkholderia pseudomallei]
MNGGSKARSPTEPSNRHSCRPLAVRRRFAPPVSRAARRPRKAAAARGADACAGARVRAPAVRYRLIGL